MILCDKLNLCSPTQCQRLLTPLIITRSHSHCLLSTSSGSDSAPRQQRKSILFLTGTMLLLLAPCKPGVWAMSYEFIHMLWWFSAVWAERLSKILAGMCIIHVLSSVQNMQRMNRNWFHSAFIKSFIGSSTGSFSSCSRCSWIKTNLYSHFFKQTVVLSYHIYPAHQRKAVSFLRKCLKWEYVILYLWNNCVYK